jgi:prepilin-type N-terminal cleavage/methylation domain-containing protein
MKNGRRGFTLVEMMIVVCIVGILLAIGVPNYLRARATSRLQAIVSNLRQIDTAVQEWGMSQNKPQGTPVLQSYLDGSGGGTSYLTWPTGPMAGTYSVTTTGANATFDGGTLGAMDAETWRTTCAGDPIVCGL